MTSRFDGIGVAARTLRKQLGFTTVVVSSLALAIALNTTMYSILDALIHPRVDIREPDRLFKIRFFGDYRHKVKGAVKDSLMRLGTPSVEALAWWDPVSAYRRSLVASDRMVTEASVAPVSIGYMPVMGPKVIAGRTFIPADENTAARPIVLHEQLMNELFAPGTDPIGKTVSVQDTTYTVIGVLSRYADFPGATARAWTLATAKDRKAFQLNSWIVRVKPGVTRQQLDKELKTVTERISVFSGDPPADDAFRVAGPTKEDLAIQGLHRALIMAVVAVLLVACANVANMQLARGIARSRELALRSALGASRMKIIQHLVTESVLLAGGGLVLGLVLTLWGAAAMHASIPPAVGQYIVEPQMSWRVLVFAVVATVACILLVGVAPAIKVSRVDPNEMLKRGHGTGSTRRNRRDYAYLVVAEMALALALLSMATVTVRGALASAGFWMGFDPAHLASGTIADKPSDVVGKPVPEVMAAMQQRIDALPGVERSAVDVLGSFENGGVMIADSSGAKEISVLGYSYREVTPSFVRTRGLAITAGRDFRDGERDVPAIIIDEVTARKFWPNANPIGSLMKLGDARSLRPFVRVVGVYSAVDEHGKPKPAEMRMLLDGSIGTILYLPGMNDTVRASPTGVSFVGQLVVRTVGDPGPVAIAMRRAGVTSAQTMDAAMGLTQFRVSRNFMAKVFTLFAGLALGLALFGIYGVVAHSVAERQREIGVRIALGATGRDILHAVLRETVVIGLSGIALGLFFTKYGVILVSGLSAGYDIFNAPMFAIVGAVFLGASAMSAFLPARRATLVDPTESLRSE